MQASFFIKYLRLGRLRRLSAPHGRVTARVRQVHVAEATRRVSLLKAAQRVLPDDDGPWRAGRCCGSIGGAIKSTAWTRRAGKEQRIEAPRPIGLLVRRAIQRLAIGRRESAGIVGASVAVEATGVGIT